MDPEGLGVAPYGEVSGGLVLHDDSVDGGDNGLGHERVREFGIRIIFMNMDSERYFQLEDITINRGPIPVILLRH